jgi:hypothetical protein
VTTEFKGGANTSTYTDLASALRGLVPAMNDQESRGDLQRLAADYERLARFSDARRRLIEAQKRRSTRHTLAVPRTEMETLFAEFDRALVETLRNRTEFIRTELELGLTFLDCAKAREGSLGWQGCIRNAITALRTAERFLAMQPGLDDAALADIRQRRLELHQRLHEILARR